MEEIVIDAFIHLLNTPGGSIIFIIIRTRCRQMAAQLRNTLQ